MLMCSVRYPPYTDRKTGMLSWLLKKTPKSDKVLLSFFPILIIAILLGIGLKVLNLPLTSKDPDHSR